MTVAQVATALQRLDKSIDGLDRAVRNFEAKPRSTRRLGGQNDLFGPGQAPANTSAAPVLADIDKTFINERLDRAIEQIETALRG